jgi:16S rRNA (guanine(966)-N(2))-methyltransferase RsmD
MDRQKETLFNILMAEFPCSGVLDVFAGSGGLGIEALSRGAERATFVESGRHALPVLERNLVELGLRERSDILALPAERLDPTRLHHELHLVFLDPPFPLVLAHPERMSELVARLLPRLDEGGVLTLRVPVEAHVERCLPVGCQPYRRIDSGESIFLLCAAAAPLSADPGNG